jgi:hypothetical protein
LHLRAGADGKFPPHCLVAFRTEQLLVHPRFQEEALLLASFTPPGAASVSM